MVCDEWQLPCIPEAIPLFGQSGDDRYIAVDKMILKGVDVLPHALINNVEEKLGLKGEKLREYVRWLSDRILSLRTSPRYRPTLHIDVYGTIGLIFDMDPVRCADYIASLEQEAQGLPLYIEGPVDAGNKPDQIRMLTAITKELTRLGSGVKIVADEWCNTYQDIVDFTDAAAATWCRLKPRISAAFITSWTRCCTATNTRWKPIRAVPVTKPRSAPAPAFTSRWPRVRCAC